MEYQIQLENDQVAVIYIKLMPQEETELHYDAHSHIVVALRGGIITRLEADGSITEVNFPTGKSVFRSAENADKIHKSVNRTSSPIELIIIQLK